MLSRHAAGRIPARTRLGQRLPGSLLPLRPFTNRSRLQISSPLGRPQLPFLSPLSPSRPILPLSIHLRQHFARLITTGPSNYKKRLSYGIKAGLTFSAVFVLLSVIQLGVYQEDIEHKWPTPPEWSLKSRWSLRSAQALQHPEYTNRIITDWPMVAGYLRELIERLENVNGEGAGLREQEEGGILVEGVGRTGLDISAKSEAWRRGYFQALMGSAKAAENLEGWVTDTKERISAPQEHVVGPSNPRPKPMPRGVDKVMREENCEPASPPPETFYMKILTTGGFETRQKLEAALAYADWLDYKGLGRTAGDMYAWALDIAAGGVEGDASSLVDVKTGLLKNVDAAPPSENLMRVSTALAVHNARQGDLPTALSLFTSVLKAWRSLPVIPEPISLESPNQNDSGNIFASLFTTLKTVLVPVKYPPPPPSGNTPPTRTTGSLCHEAGLMTYIGEIIYASSSREQGLAWTRDAVEMAESTLSLMENSSDADSRTKCAQCLKVGLQNWKTMVSALVEKTEKEQLESVEQAKKAWYGGDKSLKGKTEELRRWKAEQEILNERIKRLFPALEWEGSLEGLSTGSSLYV